MGTITTTQFCIELFIAKRWRALPAGPYPQTTDTYEEASESVKTWKKKMDANGWTYPPYRITRVTTTTTKEVVERGKASANWK